MRQMDGYNVRFDRLEDLVRIVSEMKDDLARKVDIEDFQQTQSGMTAYTPISKYKDLLADCNRKTDLDTTDKLDLRVQKLEAMAQNIEKQSSQTQKILDRCEIDLTKQAKKLTAFITQMDDLKGKTFL